MNAKISIVAAMDEKRGIGKNDRIPWHIKEDLVKLRNLTKGHAVVLGRKTYESMVWYYEKSGKEMPGKIYVIVTHERAYKPTRVNAIVADSIEKALAIAKQNEQEEIFVIGGAKIFEQTIHLSDRLYLTIVKGSFDADTFFPEYGEFKKVLSKEQKNNDEYHYIFLELER